LVELLDRQVKQLLYRSGRSVGEVYRLLGDLLDKLELEDDEKELLIQCRTYLQYSMDVLESQKRI
jgi:hypothetical protein